MIDPMATGTVKRPPANLRRRRGRKTRSTHPPTRADDTTSGSLEQRPEITGARAALLPPESRDARKTGDFGAEAGWRVIPVVELH